MSSHQPYNPIAKRIISLDILRGFALLGILIMNIQAFAMPFSAYMNPTAYGDLSGINLYSWGFAHIFADGKFITLFSLLFGAGVVMFVDNVRQRSAWDDHRSFFILHYRRSLILLVIGLLHANFIWFGDILMIYGICALGLCFFVNFRPTQLMVIGVLLHSIIVVASIHQDTLLLKMPADEVRLLSDIWAPTTAAIEAHISALTGTWAQVQQVRFEQVQEQQALIAGLIIDLGGTMLIGMALYKWGILSGQRTESFYRSMVVIGLAIALPLIVAGMITNFKHEWEIYYSMGSGRMFNYVASFAMAMSYIGVVMIAIKHQWRPNGQKRLAAVGQMALSNYILQSLLCTWLFYGYGLGLFGQVERYQQLLIVIPILALQLWLSPIWLAKFRFGPLEWLWRSLTYRQWQTIRR
jgi:uncharacterized protein